VNTLRFDSADEYSAILRGEKPLEISHEYGGKYCVLIDHYKHKLEKKNEWVRDFKGERCVVIDGGDKPNYWEPFIGFCTDSPHIYIKDNSYTPTDNPNVRIGCYRPGDKSIAYLSEHGDLREERPTDVMFRGDLHFGRNKKAKALTEYCQALNENGGLRYDIGKPKYGRNSHLEKMRKAKVVVCFKGKGTRTRRQWEAALCGAVCLCEKELADWWPILSGDAQFDSLKRMEIELFDMAFDNRFLRMRREANFSLARKCFVDCTVPIHLRMAALYALYAEPQMWTYEEVEKAEAKHGLS